MALCLLRGWVRSWPSCQHKGSCPQNSQTVSVCDAFWSTWEDQKIWFVSPAVGNLPNVSKSTSPISLRLLLGTCLGTWAQRNSAEGQHSSFFLKKQEMRLSGWNPPQICPTPHSPERAWLTSAFPFKGMIYRSKASPGLGHYLMIIKLEARRDKTTQSLLAELGVQSCP